MKNIAKIKKVIRENCEATGQLSSSDGECVVGGMALAAGVPLRVLKRHESVAQLPKRWLEKIMDFYEISFVDLRGLENKNDSYDNLKARRIALRREIETL